VAAVADLANKNVEVETGTFFVQTEKKERKRKENARLIVVSLIDLS
jgi:ABC-type amino acid transport substrate-binding protein